MQDQATPNPNEHEAAATEAGTSSESSTPAADQDLAQALEKAHEESRQLQDQYLRARADIENVRRRAEADLANARKFAVESFARDLLDVKDSLELALSQDQSLESLKGGVEVTLKQLSGVFERNHLSEINPAGEKFDPNLHQAMGMLESDLPANTVVQVLQKGYLLNERVLRPALVMVSRGQGG